VNSRAAASHVMSPEPFFVKTPVDLARAIAVSAAAGMIGTTHLLKALQQGRIALLPAPANTSATKFKDWARMTTGRPAVALIGDDDGLDRGPAPWPVAARAVAWSRSILIHAPRPCFALQAGAREAIEQAVREAWDASTAPPRGAA
jgi:hypothetical protein